MKLGATVDTGGQCTGECCRRFTLSQGGGWLTAGEVALLQAHQNKSNCLIWRVVLVEENGHGIFTCRDFDADAARCRDYANRPDACRGFPGRQTCHYCGFSVAKRRRAIRRMIREAVISRRLEAHS